MLVLVSSCSRQEPAKEFKHIRVSSTRPDLPWGTSCLIHAQSRDNTAMKTATFGLRLTILVSATKASETHHGCKSRINTTAITIIPTIGV